MQIVRYTKEKKDEWDSFVESSKNGTFLFKRDYMDYHADRFTDCSFMFYEKEKLIAILPANINDSTLYSHQGLTYGGLILTRESCTAQVLHLFEEFLSFLKKEIHIDKVLYKTIPYIYHSYPAEEDLYALFRCKAVLKERKISSAIFMENALPMKTLRKRGIAKAKNNELQIKESTDSIKYWSVLNETLQNKHHTAPVHSSSEMNLLLKRFPHNIYIFEVLKNDKILGGCVVYSTKNVAHIQYIAANPKGKELGALDLLFNYLIKERFHTKKYIDFGTSVEQGGWYLNEGLIFQKEGFGGRAIVYDTYEIIL
ncbi:MAG: GNAT family N-acetyltransferase [Bacteroides sp.]